MNRCVHLHRVECAPRLTTLPCIDSADTIRAFLLKKQIDVVLYKSGMQEGDLCYALNIECQNLDVYGVKNYPTRFHDPLEEVLYFRDKFLPLMREGELNMEWEANDKTDALNTE